MPASHRRHSLDSWSTRMGAGVGKDREREGEGERYFDREGERVAAVAGLGKKIPRQFIENQLIDMTIHRQSQ